MNNHVTPPRVSSSVADRYGGRRSPLRGEARELVPGVHARVFGAIALAKLRIKTQSLGLVFDGYGDIGWALAQHRVVDFAAIALRLELLRADILRDRARRPGRDHELDGVEPLIGLLERQLGVPAHLRGRANKKIAALSALAHEVDPPIRSALS